MYKLFTYGTLRRGFNNHSMLRNSIFLGESMTKESYLLTDIGLPILINYQGDGAKRVKGELYIVTQETLNMLDRLEGHPMLYRRETIKVSSPFDNKFEDALVYFFNVSNFAEKHLKYVEGLEEWTKK